MRSIMSSEDLSSNDLYKDLHASTLASSDKTLEGVENERAQASDVDMVQLKNITESLGETAESDKSELRMKHLDERAMARLKQEIAQVELETEDLGKRRNEQKKAILRAGQKAEALQRELAEGREVLDSLGQDTVRCEEDYAVLMKCMQEDQCRTVNDLLLRIKKQSIEAKQRHKVLDKDWEKTATTERQWESTEEAILQLCQERKALTNHWKTSVSHMTKRHQDMDQCIMSLSVVKEEVEQKRGAVKMAEETLESSRRRSAAVSRLLEAVSRQAAELKAGRGERESQSTALCGECEVLRHAVDRANTEVKMAESLLAELTAELLANKDRLEKARLHSAALEEKLKTEMEVLVRGKEEAEQAEQEVMKEEQANKDADARFYGHQEALSQKAEELQALRREEKEQQAEVSAGRGALSTVSRKQREMHSILTRKLEAVDKQDSRMELLERRMQELGAGEDRKQELGAGVDREWVELLKEQAAKISMDVEERRRTLRHGEQQNLEGKLRLAKREAERLAWEGQDLSCKVEDLRLATAAAERELSETTGQRPELMVRENLLVLEVKEARDRLQSGKDRIVALETQQLLLAAEFKGKVSELNLRKEVVQMQIKQVRQRCQKTSVERSRQRCKVQKLQKRHEAIAVSAIFPEGEEVSLQQYKAEVTRLREELLQRKEDLNRKLTTKRAEVTALKNKLSAVRGHSVALHIAPKSKECDQTKALERTLRATQDKHALKTSQRKELKENIKAMNLSLDELLGEEREGLRKLCLVQDLCSEIHGQEEELSQSHKVCSELSTNTCSDTANDDKIEEEEDVEDWHELQEFSQTVETLLLKAMDKYPDLRSVLQALLMKSGLALHRPGSVWDSQQSAESMSSHCRDSPDRSSIKTRELRSRDAQPAIQAQGSPSQLANHQRDSGRGSTNACWGGDSSTPSEGRSSRSSINSRTF